MDLPRDFVEEAAKAEKALIPKKSCKFYEKEYLKFRKWMDEKHANLLCEAVVLSYLSGQGTMLDRIDYNIEQTQTQVHQGYQQLQKAENYQKKNRKIVCILILALVTLVLLVLLIVIKS